MINTLDNTYFYNRGLDGILKITGNIIFEISDNDYQELINGYSKSYLLYKGFGAADINLEKHQFFITYNNDIIEQLRIDIYTNEEELRVNYKTSRDICEYTTCQEKTLSFEHNEFLYGNIVNYVVYIYINYFLVNENLIINKDMTIHMKNPNQDSKIIIDEDYMIDIDGGIIDILIDDMELLDNIYQRKHTKDYYRINFIDGVSRGQFEEIKLNIPNNNKNIEPIIDYDQNLSIYFRVQDNVSTTLAWYYILIIVIAIITITIITLILLIFFVKPVRYAIFPYRKRRDLEKKENNNHVTTSKIYEGKVKKNPLHDAI